MRGRTITNIIVLAALAAPLAWATPRTSTPLLPIGAWALWASAALSCLRDERRRA